MKPAFLILILICIGCRKEPSQEQKIANLYFAEGEQAGAGATFEFVNETLNRNLNHSTNCKFPSGLSSMEILDRIEINGKTDYMQKFTNTLLLTNYP